jgi:NADH-quinone oxidoreductase subunit G
MSDSRTETTRLAERIAHALQNADRPLVVSGMGCQSESVLKAASNVARALAHAGKSAHIALTIPECNSLGLALLHPRPMEEAFAVVRDGDATVIILENDLYRRAPAAGVDPFLRASKHLMVLDHLHNQTTRAAELILPAATFAEGAGTVVNNGG